MAQPVDRYPKINLRADHESPLRQIALKAFLGANEGNQNSYGGDIYTQELLDLLERYTDSELKIALAPTGTAANILALQALKFASQHPAAAVLTPAMAHINVHEAGAIESALGAAVIDLSSHDGIITPQQIEDILRRRPKDSVFSQPKIVAITNPTEVGTVWTEKQLEDLSNYCRSRGLFLFIDGARIWNAAAHLDYVYVYTALRKLTKYADAFTIGMIKNGGGTNDIICVRSELMPTGVFEALVKRQGLEHAKMRYAAAPVLADLKDRTEALKAADHANSQALKLSVAMKLLGIENPWKTEANMVWPLVPNEIAPHILRHISAYEETNETGNSQLDSDWAGRTLIRLVTSHNTTDEEIETAAEVFHSALSNAS